MNSLFQDLFNGIEAIGPLCDWFFGNLCCRYGVILEQIQTQDPSVMGRIRGCIIDSAPVAHPDPQVKTQLSDSDNKSLLLVLSCIFLHVSVILYILGFIMK